MVQFRPLPLMTLLTIAAFAVLMLVGRWQWEKYETKHALVDAPVAEMTLENYEPIESGVQLVYAVAPGGVAGWRVFAPVRYGDTIVFVDADFIATITPPDWREVRLPATLRVGAPISGAPLRPTPAAAFTPAPSLIQRLWSGIDLDAMGRNAGLEDVADYYLATSYLGPDGRAASNPFARPAGADTLPPERHLGYALTWWGLGLALMAVYFAYHVSSGRLRLAPAKNDD